MGYNTDYVGVIKFKTTPTEEELSKLNEFLDEDVRDHPEWWENGRNNLTYIDLDFTNDGEGLEWNGSEKSYDMAHKINLIIREMRKSFPDFGFTGQIRAQGEDMDDRYTIVFNKEGFAYEVTWQEELEKKNNCKCPECGCEFKQE